MRIGIVNLNRIDEIERDLEIKHQLGTAREKEHIVYAQEVLNRVKDIAIKVDDGFEDNVSSYNTVINEELVKNMKR